MGWDVRSAFRSKTRIRETTLPIINEPVHQIIVPEDTRVFAITHPEFLSLIKSPLALKSDVVNGDHSHPEAKAPAQVEEHSPGATGESTSQRSGSEGSSEHKLSAAADSVRGEPVLKRAHESSSIQLFFDLYFVANLTTFSGIHEIHDWNALRSYLGYFTIIWFTWLQNTMFDVRFSNDSAFERFCKAAQFGVMTGFAITGPGYTTGFVPGTDDAILAVSAFQTLSLILMTSRLILTFQYGVSLFWLRSYRKAWLPMLAHMTILFTSAMIFLGLYFAFSQYASEQVLAGWYVVVVMEAVLIMFTSQIYKFLSFAHTVLVERLGLLTLIILGEGIISMCNALNAVGTDNSYTAKIIGQIICCVVITYFMWMLYFDAVQPDRMGEKRTHVWAILHFPFHASVVLVVEAMAQLAIWQKVIDVTNPLIDAVAAVSRSRPTEEQVSALNDTIVATTARFLQVTTFESTANYVKVPDETENLEILMRGNSTSEEIRNSLSRIYSEGVIYVCGKFKITPPEDAGSGDGGEEDAAAQADAIFQLFETVFVYFFIFAGCVLILLAILFVIGKKHKLRAELLNVWIRLLSGTGLSLLAVMAAPGLLDQHGDDSLHRFMYSAWMLPTVLLVYFSVIVLDNMITRYTANIIKWREHLYKRRPSMFHRRGAPVEGSKA